MKDGYIDFANSAMSAKHVNALGLPKPLQLDRYQEGQPVVKGSVLVGGHGETPVLEALARFFQSIGAQTLAHARLPQWVGIANKAGLTTGRWGSEGAPGEKVKALVFDATGLSDSTQSDALYWFFHDAARSVLPSGRVVIIGRPPELCSSPRQATVQRSTGGLRCPAGEEWTKGIVDQLPCVAEGAERVIDSTWRYLAPPPSACVSCPGIRIGQAVGPRARPA